MFFYILMVPVAIMMFVMIWHLLRLRKHDKVLYRICQIRREAMSFLREDFETINRDEYIAIRRLLFALNTTIKHYKEHKTVIFNFRIFRDCVAQDKAVNMTVETVAVPDNARIQKLYKDMAIAYVLAFFAYTPLLRSEFVIRVFAHIPIVIIRQVAEVAAKAKEQGEELGIPTGIRFAL